MIFFLHFHSLRLPLRMEIKVQAFDPMLGQWLNRTVLDVDNIWWQSFNTLGRLHKVF